MELEVAACHTSAALLCADRSVCVFKVKWEEQNYLPSGLNVTNKQIPVIFVKHIPFPWRYTQFKDLTLLL